MNTAIFDASSLDRPFEVLGQCPDELLDSVVTLSERLGTLDQRVRGVRCWYDGLIKGMLPEGADWPPGPVGRSIQAAMRQLGIAPFCKDQHDLVISLVGDILAACSRQSAHLSDEWERLRRELIQLEEDKRRAARKGKKTRRRAGGAGSPGDSPDAHAAAVAVPLDMAALQARVDAHVDGLELGPDKGLIDAWADRVRDWTSLAEVFGELGDLLNGRGWDLSRGALRQTGWRDAVRLRELLEKLPQLQEIVRSLGRLHFEDHDEPSVAQTVFAPMQRAEIEWRERPAPRVPADVRGVVRSDAIARMLPSEAVLLNHPALKMLWHARRAERALLTYRVEGTEWVRERIERDATASSEDKAPRQGRGPIIAVVDTSGSMHGTPEQVAKALVLEAARTAHAERRQCLLFAYGSTGEVLEHALDLSADGVAQLLGFLTRSFGGGTDTAGVLGHVLNRLSSATWAKADVLLVSDGEWGLPAPTVAQVGESRSAGHRFHGVQVGSGNGLASVCDPVHRFVDWRL